MTTDTESWIEHVQAADADAEAAWLRGEEHRTDKDAGKRFALLAIAAELRAQRIWERPPGWGES